MTYAEIISLGWQNDDLNRKEDNNKNFTIQEEHGYWLMGIFMKTDEEGFHNMTSINWVDGKVKVNRWENCETNFYGNIKTVEDLKNIMRYVGVIEY